MTYFFRQQQMAKGWGKEINAAWDEVDHPRGKTTPESNDGSFMPKGGGASHENGGIPRGAVEVPGSGGRAYQAPPEQSMPGGKFDPNYVNQDNWTLSNKQPSPAEMRQHGREMGQAVRDVADAVPGSVERLAEVQQRLAGEYGKDYARQTTQYAADLMKDPAAAANAARLDALADAGHSHTAGEAKAKAPPLGPGVKGTSYVPHDKVDVGAILYTAWGYDQTNTEFYEVTGASKSGKTVTIRELAKETSDSGFLAGHTRPVLGHYREGEKPMTKKVSASNTLKIHGNYGYGHLWDGTDKSVSWGH